MKDKIEQGDILKIEGVSDPILVISRNYYNSTNKIIACPIVKKAKQSVLNVEIITPEISGNVLSDQIKNFNLEIRGYEKISKIDTHRRMLISDIVQGLFDYI